MRGDPRTVSVRSLVVVPGRRWSSWITRPTPRHQRKRNSLMPWRQTSFRRHSRDARSPTASVAQRQSAEGPRSEAEVRVLSEAMIRTSRNPPRPAP